MLLELDVDDGSKPPLDQRVRQHRDILGDQPLLAKPPHPPRDRGGRERHRCGESLRGCEIVGLEEIEKRDVAPVERLAEILHVPVPACIFLAPEPPKIRAKTAPAPPS